jgi:hypothetical protein
VASTAFQPSSSAAAPLDVRKWLCPSGRIAIFFLGYAPGVEEEGHSPKKIENLPRLVFDQSHIGRHSRINGNVRKLLWQITAAI